MKLSTINQIVEWILEYGDQREPALTAQLLANEAAIYLKTALICESEGIDKAMEYFMSNHPEDEYQEFRTGVIGDEE